MKKYWIALAIFLTVGTGALASAASSHLSGCCPGACCGSGAECCQ